MDNKRKKDKRGSIKFNVFLNKKIKTLRLAAFVVGLIAGGVLILWPAVKEIMNFQNEHLPAKVQEADLLNQYSQKIFQLESTINSYQATHQSDLQKLSELLPTKAELPQLIAQLDSLVTASGFRLSLLEMSQESPVAVASQEEDADSTLEQVKKINITMAVTGGNYPSFKNLLANIESNIRIIDLLSFDFKGSNAQENSYSLNLRTYFLDDQSL